MSGHSHLGLFLFTELVSWCEFTRCFVLCRHNLPTSPAADKLPQHHTHTEAGPGGTSGSDIGHISSGTAVCGRRSGPCRHAVVIFLIMVIHHLPSQVCVPPLFHDFIFDLTQSAREVCADSCTLADGGQRAALSQTHPLQGERKRVKRERKNKTNNKTT